MSTEPREVFGVRAGEYQIANGNLPANERNAIAYLLAVPWIVDLWWHPDIPMYQLTPWSSTQTANLLMHIQLVVPTMSRATLVRAIEMLARYQTEHGSEWPAKQDAEFKARKFGILDPVRKP